MPPSKKRMRTKESTSRPIKNYSDEDLKRGLKLIKQGWTYMKAAAATNVPKSTLGDYCKKFDNKYKYKPTTKLEEIFEKALVQRLQSLPTNNHINIFQHIVQLVKEIYNDCGVRNPFKNNEFGIPSVYWMNNFYDKHPEVLPIDISKISTDSHITPLVPKIEHDEEESASNVAVFTNDLMMTKQERCIIQQDVDATASTSNSVTQSCPSKKTYKKSSYTQEEMQIAVELVKKKGFTYERAALATNIPRSSIAEYIRLGKQTVPKRGRSIKLNIEFEKVLANEVQKLKDHNIKNVRKVLGKLACNLCGSIGEDNPFKNNVDSLPSKKWVSGFIQRHPELRDITDRKIRIMNYQTNTSDPDETEQELSMDIIEPICEIQEHEDNDDFINPLEFLEVKCEATATPDVPLDVFPISNNVDTPQEPCCTEEDLSTAVDLINKGWSISRVSLKTNIPISTLSEYCKKIVRFNKSNGHPRKVESRYEGILVFTLQKQLERGIKHSKQEIAQFVKNIYDNCKVPNPFKNTRDELPSKKWVNCFLARHPEFRWYD